jgi:hypothetical protein
MRGTTRPGGGAEQPNSMAIDISMKGDSYRLKDRAFARVSTDDAA